MMKNLSYSDVVAAFFQDEKMDFNTESAGPEGYAILKLATFSFLKNTVNVSCLMHKKMSGKNEK